MRLVSGAWRLMPMAVALAAARAAREAGHCLPSRRFLSILDAAVVIVCITPFTGNLHLWLIEISEVIALAAASQH